MSDVGKDMFDLVVIGGGPGGYAAAIKAAQLGLKVACVEKRSTLGGTCLNVGCIPSKALLESSEKYYEALHHLGQHGVVFDQVRFELDTLMARKEKVIRSLCDGIDYLFKKNKVTRHEGLGKILSPGAVEVSSSDGKKEILKTKHILVATGSEPMPLPGVAVDEDRVVTSTGALSLKKVPENMVVVGGGYIGLEMAAVWCRLGSKVTVVEFADRLVPAMDHELGAALHKALEKIGVAFKLSTKVTDVALSQNITLTLSSVDSKQASVPQTLVCDTLLLAIGRRPYTQGLGLEGLGIKLDNRGRVPVNAHYETAVKGIYAIGDVIDGPMLAHKAEEEAIAVVETLAGQAGHVNYGVIPAVVYTWPEVATVGKTEEELKGEKIAYRIGKFPFSANSRARASGDSDGFVKVLSHKETDRLLGVHIIGPYAGTLIAEAAAVMEFGGAAEDLARICHAHPTLNEAVKEAAMAAYNKPIHM